MWVTAGENCPAAANTNNSLLIGSTAISEAVMPRSCATGSQCCRAGYRQALLRCCPRTSPNICVILGLQLCSRCRRCYKIQPSNHQSSKKTNESMNLFLQEAGRQRWSGMNANHKSFAAIVQTDRVSHQNETGLWRPLCSKFGGWIHFCFDIVCYQLIRLNFLGKLLSPHATFSLSVK